MYCVVFVFCLLCHSKVEGISTPQNEFGLKRGFGFVTFANRADAQHALENHNEKVSMTLMEVYWVTEASLFWLFLLSLISVLSFMSLALSLLLAWAKLRRGEKERWQMMYRIVTNWKLLTGGHEEPSRRFQHVWLQEQSQKEMPSLEQRPYRNSRKQAKSIIKGEWNLLL